MAEVDITGVGIEQAGAGRKRPEILVDIMRSRLLTFEGCQGLDVYNITAPFVLGGRSIIAARVERRDQELSRIGLFEQGELGRYAPVAGFGGDGAWPAAFEGLQDPCVAVIGGMVVLGGVRFPIVLEDGKAGWVMEFYQFDSANVPQLVFRGPTKMKDIRLVELTGGRVGVFTRPQGVNGGRGRVGYISFASLQECDAEALYDAPLIDMRLTDEEWVGANEAHLLADGRIGVLGHVAAFDAAGNKCYQAMCFEFDPKTHTATPLRVLAKRADFPDAPAKKPDLVNVVFSGGLSRHGDATATLYAGLSDAAAGVVRISDPWS